MLEEVGLDTNFFGLEGPRGTALSLEIVTESSRGAGMPVRFVVTAPELVRRRLSVSSEMVPAVEVFFSRTAPEAVALPGLLSMSSLLALLSLLSWDSKASEVEDLELFIPEEAVGRGRARSIPWLPTLVTGFQDLAVLLMFFRGSVFSEMLFSP